MSYKYTNEDIEFLKTNYPIGNWSKIHDRFPTLSRSSIHHKCHRLGIKFDNDFKRKFDNTMPRNKWTEQEINILKKYYSCVPIEDVLKLLPNRNIAMIRNKATNLKLTS